MGEPGESMLTTVASTEKLDDKEDRKISKMQKRSSSMPEMNVSEDKSVHGEPFIHDVLTEALGEDKPSDTEAFIKSILSEAIAHVPSGGSDHQTTAESVVQNILADLFAPTPVDEVKSGESVAHSVLSGILSHLSSEVAAHRVSLDCDYLKEHLGKPLALALCEIILKRPVDPIHYLAHWLFKWRWNQQQKKVKEEEINALNLERERMLAEIKEKERLEAERKAILEHQKEVNEAAVNTLEIALDRAFEIISQEGETAAGEETGEDTPISEQS